MSLQKGFLHRKPEFSEIPARQKILGVITGVFFAFSFYAFLYLLREILRQLTATPPELFWNLTDEEISFYNFFFAALAAILGQAVCINIWINKGKIFFGPLRLRKIQVLHDQRFMIWYFLSWFLKLAMIHWALFGYAFKGGHYVFSLYPDYKYLFYLILLVLFLQSWTSFRRLYPKQSLKWFLTVAVCVFGFAFALSRIDFIDQEAFRKRVQGRSIHHVYSFSLPEAHYYQGVYMRHHSLEVVIVQDDAKEGIPYSIFVERKEVLLDSLANKVAAFQTDFNWYNHHRAHIRFHIDRNVAISFVEKVKRKVSEAGIKKAYYMVIPRDREYDVRYYNNLGIAESLADYALIRNDSISQPVIEKAPLRTDSANVQIQVNTRTSISPGLKEKLKDRLRNNPNRIVRYRYNANDKFEQYITVLSTVHQAVHELRMEYALKKYATDYEELYGKSRDDVESKYRAGFSSQVKGK